MKLATRFVFGSAIAALALPAHAQELLGLRFNNDAVLSISTGSGTPTELFRADTIFPSSLAWNDDTQTLYTTTATNELVSIDLATQATTIGGPLGFQAISGMTYDPFRKTLFGVDVNADRLVRIDIGTGAASAVGSINALGMEAPAALVFDPGSNTLLATDTLNNTLWRVDPDTGVGTEIGPLGFSLVQGLAIHPTTGVLYGVDNDTTSLLTIDPTTGQATAVGTIGLNFIQGLTFTPAPGAFAAFFVASPLAVRRRRSLQQA